MNTPTTATTPVPLDHDATPLSVHFDEARATVHCPACGSREVRQINVAVIWAPVDRWEWDDEAGTLIPADVDVCEAGDMETVDEDRPYVCAACQQRHELAELDVRVRGVRVEG